MTRCEKNHLKLIQNNKKPSAWQRVGRFLIKVLVLGLLVLILVAADNSLRINEIMVKGAEVSNPEQIIEAAGLEIGSSMIFFREERVANKIIKHIPRIKNAQVTRQLPDRILISVSERQAVAYIKSGSGYWLIDDDIFCFAFTDEPKEGTILLSGVDELQVTLGTGLSCPVRSEALIEFFSEWPGEAGLQVSEIKLEDKFNLVVQTAEGMEIWFGSAGDMRSKIELIDQCVPHINISYGTILDLRTEKRLVISNQVLGTQEGVNP